MLCYKARKTARMPIKRKAYRFPSRGQQPVIPPPAAGWAHQGSDIRSGTLDWLWMTVFVPTTKQRGFV